MGSVIAVAVALIGGFVQSDGTRTGRRSTSWFRGHFWLATIVVLTVQYVGDAAGHIYFWLADNNTKPYNIGIPLWTDSLLPIVMWALYVASRRRNGDAVGSISVRSAGLPN